MAYPRMTTNGAEARGAFIPANVSGRLSEFDGRDGPVPFVASDRDAQAMYFVEPNALNRTGLAVGEDHGLADKLIARARQGSWSHGALQLALVAPGSDASD